MKKPDKNFWLIIGVMAFMLVYFLLATPAMNDDGFHYEGFAESLARGKLDFKSFYGFQGLSFFAVPIFWLTGSHNSIIITSIIFSLLSIPLAFLVGRAYFSTERAGWYFLALFLLMPYPYATMFRGFQEAALLFFILLILYGSLQNKIWTPLAWAVGGIVKPFALILFPLWLHSVKLPRHSTVFGGFNRVNYKKIIWILVALTVGGAYLGVSFYQTGHFVNNAAINSYQGDFDTGNPPPLKESFVPSIKGFLRVGANLLLSFRKIMVSPFVIMLGVLVLWRNKTLPFRKEIILAILLNFLLVGSLTFSFSKYLLPMTTLLALASVSYLLKYPWLWLIVLADSFFVFKPIFSFFGHSYWSNVYIYLLPLFMSFAMIITSYFFHGREKSMM